MRLNTPRRVQDLRRLTTMTSVPNATPIRVRYGDKTLVVVDAQYEPDGDNEEPPHELTLWLDVEEPSDDE